MKTQLTKTTVKKRLILEDLDATWSDWGGYPNRVVEEGQEVDVLITTYEDGRIYYTAFRFEDGRLYTATNLREKGGKVTVNCGNGPVARNEVCNALGICYFKGPGRRRPAR